MVMASTWGSVIELLGFSDGEIATLRDELEGAFELVVEGEPVHTYVRSNAPLLTRSGDAPPLIERHRGGSSARKIMLDGSEFRAEQQQRSALPWYESQRRGPYEVDGVIVWCTSDETVLIGPQLGNYTLSDLVENLLLARA